MKRIIAAALTICLAAALFSCIKEPEVTAPDTATLPATDAETTTGVPVIETVTAEPSTETDQITETETDATTETEPVSSDGRADYKIYDPTLAGYDNNGTLRLYGNGKYESEMNYTDYSAGFAAYTKTSEKGSYQLDEGGEDLELTAEKVSIKLTFDNSENKEAYLSGIKSTYLMGLLDGVTYGILKNAADGGFSGSISDLSGSSLFGAASAAGSSKAVLDEKEKTAYYLVPGMALSDNEYYIAESGYTLALHDDGSCRMYFEDISEDEGGFGVCVITDVYDGTYTRSDGKISCVITENTTKYRFTDGSAEEAYKQYYEEQYSNGSIGKIYYDYYMALVSDGGYTDDDMSDTYLIELEEHTHTARILESPETER